MNWYLEVLKKYAVFTGRAQRQEYWMFVLFQFIIGFVLGIVDGVAGTGGSGNFFGVLSLLCALATFLPGLAVLVRRLHDTNRSGAWAFIALVPIVGAIVLLVFAAQDGELGDNQYGPNPKLMAIRFAPGAPAPPQPQPPQPYGYPPAPPPAQPPAPPQVQPAHHFCSNCGTQLAAGAKFCPSCGRAV